MNVRLIRIALAVPAALVLSSCGKPKELPYSKLEYHGEVFTDPQTSQAFTGIAKDYHKDGKLKAEFPFKNGKFHGTVREWYPTGKPLSETEFKNGERVGLNREWTDAGLPFRERVYDHDHIVSEKNFPAGK